MKRPASERTGRVLLLGLMTSLLGCATASVVSVSGPGPRVGAPLPELSLRDRASGQTVSLKSLVGQVVLLDIWASWCAPCKAELPLLDEIAGRLNGKGVAIIAASIDEDPESMNEFLSLKKTWNLRVMHDPLRKVPSELQPEKMPSSYVIDRNGVLQKIYTGFSRSDVDHIEQELKDLASR